jgi:hypothetical protein
LAMAQSGMQIAPLAQTKCVPGAYSLRAVID